MPVTNSDSQCQHGSFASFWKYKISRTECSQSGYKTKKVAVILFETPAVRWRGGVKK